MMNAVINFISFMCVCLCVISMVRSDVPGGGNRKIAVDTCVHLESLNLSSICMVNDTDECSKDDSDDIICSCAGDQYNFAVDWCQSTDDFSSIVSKGNNRSNENTGRRDEDCCSTTLRSLVTEYMESNLQCTCYLITESEFKNLTEIGLNSYELETSVGVKLILNLDIRPHLKLCMPESDEISLVSKTYEEVLDYIFKKFTVKKLLVSSEVFDNLTTTCELKQKVTFGRLSIKCNRFSFRTCVFTAGQSWNRIQDSDFKTVCDSMGYVVKDVTDYNSETFVTLLQKRGSLCVTLNRETFSRLKDLEFDDIQILYMLVDSSDKSTQSKGTVAVFSGGKFVASATMIEYKGYTFGLTAAHAYLPAMATITSNKNSACVHVTKRVRWMDQDYDIVGLYGKGLNDFPMNHFDEFGSVKYNMDAIAYGTGIRDHVVRGQIIDDHVVTSEGRYYKFSTSGEFEPGMSGGPVVQNGHVVGLVSADYRRFFDLFGTTKYITVLHKGLLDEIVKDIKEMEKQNRPCNIDDRDRLGIRDSLARVTFLGEDIYSYVSGKFKRN